MLQTTTTTGPKHAPDNDLPTMAPRANPWLLALIFVTGVLVGSLPFAVVLLPAWKEQANAYKELLGECRSVFGAIAPQAK